MGGVAYLDIFSIREHASVAVLNVDLDVLLRDQIVHCVWGQGRSPLPYALWVLTTTMISK